MFSRWCVHTAVELRIGKEPHKVRSVPRRDMVALKVQRDVMEGPRVAIDVQRSNRCRSRVFALVLGGFQLAEEVLGKVRRS